MTWDVHREVDFARLKIRFLFDGELRQAAHKGTLDQKLWQFLMDVSRMWAGGTQRIEGMNSFIKYIATFAPSIS
eukprot:2366002-Pyramimonas_sp.AAC.1